jgi:hypothetical protein
MHDDDGGAAAQTAAESKVCNRISLLAVLIGVGLLWPVPLAGVLLMVVASFVFVISWELNEALVAPTLLVAVTLGEAPGAVVRGPAAGTHEPPEAHGQLLPH